MDFEKYLKFGTEYLSEYVWAFTSTLRNPVLRFELVSAPSESLTEIALPAGTAITRSGTRLNPRLVSFALISIFIGSSLYELFQHPRYARVPDVGITIIVVLLSWFAFGSVVHLYCRLLNGQGTYMQTISVVLQLLAVLYVVSSFAAFLSKILLDYIETGQWHLLALSHFWRSGVENLRRPVPNPLAEQVKLLSVVRLALDQLKLVDLPFYFTIPPFQGGDIRPSNYLAGFNFFFFQFVLNAIYLPIALTHLHSFSRAKQLVLVVLIFITLVIGSYFGWVIYEDTAILGG